MSSNAELLGSLLGGKYRVRSVLGEGGMGTVFDALHEALGNVVAIKVLHQNQLQKKDSVKRFQHEARAAARIGHPNICEVYDVGTLDDGRPYLVMERLVGETLADRIAAFGGLPVPEVLDTLNQVLSGLHAAHEKAIIHRDIKPENVFLTQRVGCPPIAKLLDFGVSKVMAQHSQASGFSEMEVTRTGVVLGTPYYLAPEQARGERNLDARVDLYACGVLLYEALTGRRPFRAPNYNALLIAILTASPRPAREMRPDLPPGLDRIVEKALARDVGERYQTALEFQAALQPYLATPPPPVRRTAPLQRPAPEPSPSGEHVVSTGELLEVQSDSGDVVAPPAPPRPAMRASAPPTAAPRPQPARPSPSTPPQREARKVSHNFDESTEVDLPRKFRHESPPASRKPQPPGTSTPAAFVPRRSAPILGPPLRPPLHSPFVDDSATEIMSGAVRATLDAELAKAPPPRAPTSPPPPAVPPSRPPPKR